MITRPAINSAINNQSERRFDKGSWIALSFVLFLFAYATLESISAWQVPGDGWEMNSELRADPPRATFFLNINNRPTPLQQGDELLTVEGLTLKEIIARQFRFFEMRAPGWTDGTILHYTVRRDGQELALDVPQHLYSPGQLVVATLRILPGPTLVQLLSTLFFFIVGLVVFILRPRHRAAHALLILGMAFLPVGLSYAWVSSFFYPFPPPSIPVDNWTLAINPSIMYLALAFPAPKWPIRLFPRLTVALLYLSAPLVLNTLYLLNLDNPFGYFRAATFVYITQILCVIIITFSSLIHSTLTLRKPADQAQLKWVALGLLSFVVPGIGGWLLGFLGVSSLWLYLLSITGWFLLPICVAIAITRYRLFDIDVIIRHTLVYSVLTALLALIYYGGVVLLQQLTRPITAVSSDLAIVVSTLMIAALFFPLRRRVQAMIDRRFYWRRYDATKTLAAFGITVRDEVELDKLTSELITVVRVTMQPESISLWLKWKTGRPGRSELWDTDEL